MRFTVPHLEFQLAQEGTYVIRVTDVQFDEDWGRLTVNFVNQKGVKVRSNYNIVDKDGNVDERAAMGLAILARNATGDNVSDDIDPEDMVGCYVLADIVHTYSEKNGRTYANVRNVRPAKGWDDVPGKSKSEESFDMSLLED